MGDDKANADANRDSSNATSQWGLSAGGVSDEVKNALRSLKISSYEEVNPNFLNESEKQQVIDVVASRYNSKFNIDRSKLLIHIAVFLVRARSLGTTQKNTYSRKYSYETEGRKFVVDDSWVFNEVKSAMATLEDKKPNDIRCFCASFEDLYVSMSKMFPELFEKINVGNNGLPKGCEALGADFLTGRSRLLTDQENAVRLAASANAIHRSNTGNNSSSIVSLYQLTNGAIP